jgi:NAD(P)-dependent dehydrogenase (short-subunit alcohol dehydrogenase family)
VRDRLAGKKALIIGAGSEGEGWGIGRAIAAVFAEAGACLGLIDQNAAALAVTNEIVITRADDCRCYVADATSSASLADAISRFQNDVGGIDILVNNVGGSAPGAPDTMPEETWHQQLSLNLTSAFLGCKHVLPVMRSQQAGSIINIGSVASVSYIGRPHAGYAAAKGGLLAFTEHMAVVYASQGIRCNTVVPGLMDTPLVRERLSRQLGIPGDELVKQRHRLVPLGRMGTGFDVAYAALFLASDESRYVTGTSLVVDGALTRRCVVE